MPKLPIEIYHNLLIYAGEETANEIFDEVESGKRSVESAREWIEDVIQEQERPRKHKRDIEPWEWRDFEDGWRPDED